MTERLLTFDANIFQQMEEMAKMATKGAFQRDDCPELGLFETPKLPDFLSHFRVPSTAAFLSDKPLQILTNELGEKMGSLRYIYPEGTRINLVAFPCNANGLPLRDTHFDDNQHQNLPPYLGLLRSDSENNSGFCVGFNQLGIMPLLRLIPAEIAEKCSFIVKYTSDPKIENTANSDLQYLRGEFEIAYRNLQALYRDNQR